MSNGDRINPDFATVAVVLCAIVGLVLVAGALPPMTGQGVTDAGSGEQLGELPDEELPEEAVDDEEQSTTTDDSDDDAAAYELSVDSTTPGTNATVSVDQDGDPVEGAPILIEGDRVGETDSHGTLVHEVPFVSSVEITAIVEEGEVAAGASLSEENEQQISTTVETNDNFDIQLTGPIHPGGAANVYVTVGHSTSVPNAQVSLDDSGAFTNDAGAARLNISDDAEEFTVEAQRGELQTSETVSLPLDIDADLTPTLPYYYAMGTATVDTTPADDDIVDYEGGTVYVLDEAIEDPDAEDLEASHTKLELDGSAESFRLPVSSSATIVVDAGGEQDVFIIEDLLRNLGILVIAGMSVIFGITITYGRVLNRSFRQDLTVAGRSFKLGALNFGWLLRDLGTTYNPIATLRHAGAGLVAGTAAVFKGVLSLRMPSLSLPTLSLAMPSLSLSMPSMPSLGLGSIGRKSDDGLTEGSDADSNSDGLGVSVDEYTAAAVDVPDSEAPSNRSLVRAAWNEFAETAGVDSVETTTPGAAARQAREAGLPDPAIDALTQTFRRIEYGQGEPTDERTDRALRALAAIRAHEGGEQS